MILPYKISKLKIIIDSHNKTHEPPTQTTITRLKHNLHGACFLHVAHATCPLE